MNHVDIMLSFPTVLFTVPLGFAFLYWITVIVGVMDAEIFDGMFEGVGDAAVEGALEGAIDGAIDGAADGAAEGAELGIGQSLGFSALMLIGKVPVTISFSFFFLWNWLICMLGSEAALGVFGDSVPMWLWGIPLLIVSMVISLFVTNITARPFAPLFKTHTAISKHSLVGEVVEITTGRVDRKFGQATYEDGGAGMTLQVRCDPDAGLKKGDKAVLLSHDPDNDTFEVETIEDMVASDLDEQSTNDKAE